MKKHWKKLVTAVVALVLVVIAGSFIYAKFINKADDEFDSSDVKDLLTATTTVAPDAPVTTDSIATDAQTTLPPATVDGVEGPWVIADGSPEEVAQVEESFTGQFLRQLLPAREVAAA